MDLIKIDKNIIGDEEVNSIDARELHIFLESKQNFSDWITHRIKQYDFTQGIDFITKHNSMFSPPRKDYTLTIDMGKELSMVEKNAKGKQARLYFIECEKKAKGADLTPAEQLLRSAQFSVDLERKQKALEYQQRQTDTRIGHTENRLNHIEAKIKDDSGYFAVTGYANIAGVKIDSRTAGRLGKMSTKLSNQLNVDIFETRHSQWGAVNTYHESVSPQKYCVASSKTPGGIR